MTPQELDSVRNYLSDATPKFVEELQDALRCLPGMWKVQPSKHELLHISIEDQADNRIRAEVYVDLDLTLASKHPSPAETPLGRGRQIRSCLKIKSNVAIPGLNQTAMEAMAFNGRVLEVAHVLYGMERVIAHRLETYAFSIDGPIDD